MAVPLGWFTCAVVWTVISGVAGFNLDTTIPVVKTGPSNSYFGYSVAQHQELGRENPFKLSDEVVGNYLVVGAPILNLAGASENNTGGVYKCNARSMEKDDCELLLRNEYLGSRATADKGRRNQWLGVTVRSGGKGGEVVACAHRYKITDNNYGLGTCYQLSQELMYDQEAGQGNMISPCQGYSVRNEHEEYAFCQTGTSAYVTNKNRLIMGAPGAINWRGMLAELDIDPSFTSIKRIRVSPTTESDPIKPPVPPISYLGYAVVGGVFDNTNVTYFVAGAPRSIDYGQVVFFSEMASGSVLKYEESQILTGGLPFSGFGQDLIAVDLNNDGYNDLVVGAPFYFTEEKDNIRLGGAIYVYSGNGDMITTYTKPTLILGRSMSQDECKKLDCVHGRFGFSLTKAGDLNRDGFHDFAVGAPYEGSGAVYIFHGSEDGVNTLFSQRIYASDLSDSTGWSTFGYSLSGGLDMDDNTYPDLLVGGLEANKIAMLRTRPIIHLHSNVTVSPKALNMSSADQKKCEYNGTRWYCMQIKLCLRYTAEPVERFQERVDIIYTIVAEPERINARVQFHSASGAVQKVEDTFQLLKQSVTGLANKPNPRYAKFQEPVDIIYTIVAEPERINARVQFHSASGAVQKVEDTFQLLKQSVTGLANERNPRYACVRQTAYLKNEIQDVVTPIEFGIGYRLPEKTAPLSISSPGALPDINDYPILETGLDHTQTLVKTNVEFVKKCGDDNICQSNLLLDARVNNLAYNKEGAAVLDLGQTEKLQVAVTLQNLGEIAYQTTFYLQKPAMLSWGGYEPKRIECTHNATLVICTRLGGDEIGKPLKAGDVSEFYINFNFDTKALAAIRSFKMNAWINTTSVEQTPKEDRVTIPVVVYVKADLMVNGRAEPDSDVLYSGIVRGESAMNNMNMIGQAVNHTFTIYNDLSTVVQASEVTILWPYEMASKFPHGKHLLYLVAPPQVIGDAICIEQADIINVAGIEEKIGVYIQPRPFRTGNESEYTVVPGGKRRRRRRRREVDQSATETENQGEPLDIKSDEPRVGEARERKNSVLLDCGLKNVKCHQIRCKIGVLDAGKSVKIRLRARLWESTLLEDFREVDEVRIRSTAKLYIRPELNIVQTNITNDIGYATTIAIPSLKIVAEKPLQWWIIALAVLGGIILLIAMALCLWKLGFFKRRRFDDMKTYNVKVEKKKNIDNPTYSTNIEAKKDYNTDEKEYFLKR